MHRECVLARDSAIGGYSPYLDGSAEGKRDYVMGGVGEGWRACMDGLKRFIILPTYIIS